MNNPPSKNNDLIFLIGLHGTGKTTAGKYFYNHQGWYHISLGDLTRMARKRKILSDIPVSLATELMRHRPNEKMSERASNLLLNHLININERKNLICDGFPSEKEHVYLLPKKSIVIQLTCQHREERLKIRSESTERKWTEGTLSRRDTNLQDVVEAAKEQVRFFEVDNSGCIEETIKHITMIIQQEP